MTLRMAWITVKQHRAELTGAMMLAIASGLWALWTERQLSSISVPAGCIAAWMATGPTEGGGCGTALQAWTSVLGESVIEPMAYLPFAIGLLGGVPIVARELEARTTQTAWSLNPSRTRWLLRQLIPVLSLLGAGLAFAAIATSAVEHHRAIVGYSPVVDLGQYGALIIPRAFAAFGLGLLVGILVGRSLPAFVLGAGLAVSVTFAVSGVRETWMSQLDAVVVGEVSSDGAVTLDPTAVITGVAFRAPSGRVLAVSEARAIAHAAGVPPAEALDEQDTPALVWLQEHGYTELSLGVTRNQALGWEPYDAIIFTGVGLASLGATIVAVNRRRPV